jgi:NAD-dependent SIR2 family protein deacetylase
VTRLDASAPRPPGVGGAVPAAVVDALARVLSAGRVVVLSGAGISTESGIPDYRGPTGVARVATPMTYQEFVSSARAQQRYWARSFAGWPLMRRARPNAGHAAVTRLQQLGVVDTVITQNVDRLHHAAGTDRIVELHGALERVVCLTCLQLSDRGQLQQQLEQANPGFDVSLFADADGDTASVRPDGDLALVERVVAAFRPVECLECGRGPLKPDVVFFGENVPKDRVAGCFAAVDEADTLLVLGSSLTVMSGYRFVRHAARRGIGVVIVNQGATRGDDHATLRVEEPLGPVLSSVVAALETPRPDGRHVPS